MDEIRWYEGYHTETLIGSQFPQRGPLFAIDRGTLTVIIMLRFLVIFLPHHLPVHHDPPLVIFQCCQHVRPVKLP